METELEHQVERLADAKDVKGVVCCDAAGLLIKSTGIAEAQRICGSLPALVSAAESIENDEDNPVISLESNRGRLLIHHQSGLSIAVLKN